MEKRERTCPSALLCPKLFQLRKCELMKKIGEKQTDRPSRQDKRAKKNRGEREQEIGDCECAYGLEDEADGGGCHAGVDKKGNCVARV